MKIWFLIFDFQRVGQNDGDFDPCSSSTGLQSRSERSASRSVERARAEEEEGSRGRARDEVLLVQRHQVVRSISGTTTFSNEILEWPVKKLNASIYLKWLLRIFLVIQYCIKKFKFPFSRRQVRQAWTKQATWFRRRRIWEEEFSTSRIRMRVQPE